MGEESGPADLREAQTDFSGFIADYESWEQFDAAAKVLRLEFRPAAAAFRHNVKATVRTMDLPVRLAVERVLDLEGLTSEVFEWIRAGSIGDANKRRQIVSDNARLRVREYFMTDKGVAELTVRASEVLRRTLHNSPLLIRELRRQGIVLLWSAVEVLFRDSFETLLNLEPARVKTLFERKLIERKLTFDTLFENDFNLASCIGTVLVTHEDFSNLDRIKSVYDVLYPGFLELHNALDDERLRIFNKRRHLVVHRRGLVDQRYLTETRDDAEVGAILSINQESLRQSIDTAVVAAVALLRAIGLAKIP